MDKKTKAIKSFNEGFNCAQSVLSVFADNLGISEKTVLRISSGFGGGMGRMQKTCGAVTGAFMVIGSLYGKINKEDSVSKTLTHKKINDFAEKFKAKHGFIDCRDLLDFDMNDEVELAKAVKNDYSNKFCVKYIETAVELLEEYFV